LNNHSKIELNDIAARNQIVTDLHHNFLVEASAGSGKTSSLVQRMVALVRSGEYSIGQITAITFTRKAAIELKERFQQEIEMAFMDAAQPRERGLLQQALLNIEQCYLGTIHSFCARILRERPIEAGLDSGFKEMDEIENILFMEQAWEQYLSGLKIQDSPVLQKLEQTGIQIQDLKESYKQICQYPEIQVVRQNVSCPDLNQAMEHLISFCENAEKYIPEQETGQGYDAIQQAVLLVQRLKNYRAYIEKDFHKITLLEAFNKKIAVSGTITLNRWLSKEKAKEYRDVILPRLQEEHIEPILERWREYCHHDILKFIQPAVDYYHTFREKRSMLNFQDLLLKTVSLLRDNPDIRRYFQQKYRSILVDEFQDTDPIQAEIIFYLTGQSYEEKDWKKLVPRAGSLFIVGDPQQSIYHFRRADIAVYKQVKSLIRNSKGRVIKLNANFRSLHSIGKYLNPLFEELFSTWEGELQAKYAPMQTVREDKKGYLSGICQIVISKEKDKFGTIENDAHAIARLIRDWMDRKIPIVRRQEELSQGITPEVNFSDFMILLRYKSGMDIYARILSEYGIPVTVSGYASINQSQNIRELLKLLRLLKDPENQVLLVAVLRGIFYGFSDQELYEYKEAGGKFNFFSDIPDTLENDFKQRLQDTFGKLRMYYFWCSQLLPVNALEKIMIHSGLQPYACGDMGEDNKANELYFILEHLRKSDITDFYTYDGMVETLEKIWESGIEEELDMLAEENTVRIMNLHKAKGLESPVVFLAIPYHTNHQEPEHYIERLTEIPQGHFLVKRAHLYGKGKIIAQPEKWKEYCQLETSYLQAEETRLLYVAATRAKNLLLISSLGQDKSSNRNNPWKSLLKNIQPEMVLEIPEKQKIKKKNQSKIYSREEFEKQKEELDNWQKKALETNFIEQTPSYWKSSLRERMQPVFTVDKGGTNWGNAVHGLLQYLVSKQPSEELFLSYINDTLEKNNISLHRKDELVQLVQKFKDSNVFTRIVKSKKRFVEVPFNLKIISEDPLYQELIGEEDKKETESRPIIMTGTIDLVFQESDGWVIVDYKTDCPKNKADYSKLQQIYQKQIDIYAAIWQKICGEKVKEKIIHFIER
jgi:ATP-dependent helicase/nuclease subunit A